MHDLPASTVMRVDDDRVELDGQELFTGSLDEAVARIVGLVATGGRHLVVTPNVDQVLNLSTDRAYREAFESASLRLIDGAPLVWLAGSLGASSVTRCTGADLLPVVVDTARLAELRVVLLGGDPAVSERAAQLMDRGTGLVRAIGLPMLSSIEDERARGSVDELALFDPDIVFLALGSPKQEAWYLHWRERLPDAVYIGSGAAADFAAGHKSRAPELVQAGGLEWVWRLLQEPRRLAGRYLVKGPRFLKVILDSHSSRRQVREAQNLPRGMDVHH